LVLIMPPLRELQEDLPWIWKNVYQAALLRAKVSQKQGQMTPAQHNEVVRLLSHHPLRGNLRDLYRVANENPDRNSRVDSTNPGRCLFEPTLTFLDQQLFNFISVLPSPRQGCVRPGGFGQPLPKSAWRLRLVRLSRRVQASCCRFHLPGRREYSLLISCRDPQFGNSRQQTVTQRP